jgi:hypothetical protein
VVKLKCKDILLYYTEHWELPNSTCVWRVRTCFWNWGADVCRKMLNAYLHPCIALTCNEMALGPWQQGPSHFDMFHINHSWSYTDVSDGGCRHAHICVRVDRSYRPTYVCIYILIRNCSVSFLFYRADLTQNHQRYYEISSVLLLIYAADAAVNAGSNICRRLFGCGSNYHSQSPFLLLSTLLNFIFSIISSVWKRTRFMRSPCCVPMRSP